MCQAFQFNRIFGNCFFYVLEVNQPKDLLTMDGAFFHKNVGGLHNPEKTPKICSTVTACDTTTSAIVSQHEKDAPSTITLADRNSPGMGKETVHDNDHQRKHRNRSQNGSLPIVTNRHSPGLQNDIFHDNRSQNGPPDTDPVKQEPRVHKERGHKRSMTIGNNSLGKGPRKQGSRIDRDSRSSPKRSLTIDIGHSHDAYPRHHHARATYQDRDQMEPFDVVGAVPAVRSSGCCEAAGDINDASNIQNTKSRCPSEQYHQAKCRPVPCVSQNESTTGHENRLTHSFSRECPSSIRTITHEPQILDREPDRDSTHKQAHTGESNGGENAPVSGDSREDFMEMDVGSPELFDLEHHGLNGSRSRVPEEVRLRVNSRERQRMHDLNSALDSLRQVMPYSSGPAVKKLSKMSTLLLARNYIVMLTRSLEDMKRMVQELSSLQQKPSTPNLGPLTAAAFSSTLGPVQTSILPTLLPVGPATHTFQHLALQPSPLPPLPPTPSQHHHQQQQQRHEDSQHRVHHQTKQQQQQQQHHIPGADILTCGCELCLRKRLILASAAWRARTV